MSERPAAPWPLILLAVALAADLALLTVLRGADIQTPFVLWVLLLVLIPALAEVLRRWRAGELGPVALPLFFVLWACASNLATDFRVEGLAQTGLVVHGLLLAVAVARPLNDAQRSALLLLPALLALGYGCWVSWIVVREGAATGFARDVNNVSLALFLAGMTGLGLLRASGARVLGAGALLVGMLALLLAGPLEARAVVGILLFALLLRAFVERDGTAFAWLGIAVAAVLFVAALRLAPETPIDAAGETAAVRTEADAVVGSRAPMFATAFELLRSAPIQGYGLLSFRFFFDRTRDPGFRDFAAMVHNDYLQLGMELGWLALLGLAALAAALARVWVLGSIAALRRRATPETTLASWLALGLLGAFGHALVNFPFYDGFLLAQIAIMAVVAFGVSPLPLPLPQAARLVAIPAAAFGCLAACLVVVRIAILAVAMVVFLRHPMLPGLATDAAPPARAFALASSLRSFEFLGGMPDFVVGRQLAAAWAEGGRADGRLAEAAREAFGRAARMEPWIGDYSIQFARLQRETSVPLAERERVLDRALEWQPRDPLLYLALAVHRLRAGDERGAVAVAAERWLPWCRHGTRIGGAAHADLLALASLEGRHVETVESCVRFLRSRGYEPNDPSEVIARFTAR